MPETSVPPEIPQVRDYRNVILGLLPRNAQARVIAGLAILMVLVIMFSGQRSPKATTPSVPSSNVIDPNQARIQEYRQRLDDETRRLTLEEAQLTKTKQEFGVKPGAGCRGCFRWFAVSRHRMRPNPRDSSRAGPEQKSDLQAEQAKREYQSLFASNVALTYRPPVAMEPIVATSATGDAGRNPHLPSTPDGAISTTSGKDRVLYEGTILETVLTTRLDSSLSGPVNCMVTTNVYSPEGPTLVIPQGTRVLGEARKLQSMGEQRLAVVFHRLIRPDGSSVNLDQFKGLNEIGETGLRDQVNNHYLAIFGASLAIGAIAGLAQANTQYGATNRRRRSLPSKVSHPASRSLLCIFSTAF